MAEVKINLTLKADEFQTLRTELGEHAKALREQAKNVRDPAKGHLRRREAQVTFILEKLG